MRVVPVLLSAVLAFGFSIASASAGTFDGKWVADIPAQGRCIATGTMVLVVADGEISGEVHNPAITAPLTGKVDADGDATFTVMGRYQGTMQFSGNHFDATWFNGGCDRHAAGDRALEPSQQAALAAERRQHQTRYADLMTRAETGDKIDYNALRAESIYGENWDFYDTKIAGLIDQANADSKGGDCTATLEKTDMILKYDFTMDSAHALRADCLEDKDEASSRIESHIADGLVRSLMDSGDGDTEQTAYVVNTMHEEMDVLANRNVQIRARQVMVRGSDGHFYDEVTGISLNNNGARVRRIYFNVDSFAMGRRSKRAAIALAQAGIK